MKEIILKLIDKFSTEGGSAMFVFLVIVFVVFVVALSVVLTGYKP